MRGVLLGWLIAAPAWADPAASMPAPRAERCLGFIAEPGEQGMVAPDGLTYDQVVPALNAAVQHATRCPQPSGVRELHLTFELLVGCDGLVREVETSDAGGAPDTYVACVTAVLRKADFPAHDMRDGFPITYPIDVRW